MMFPVDARGGKAVTEVTPETLRAALDELGTDEILAVKTDCNRSDCTAMRQAFGRSWRIGFRRHGDWIWTWSNRTALTVRTTERTLADYVGMIERGEPFTWLRYGDGAFGCALNTIYPGFGFQTFTPELRADIRQSLAEHYPDERYVMALAPKHHFARMLMWGNVAHFLHDNDVDVEWAPTSTFVKALLEGELGPFVRALRDTETLVVGPPKFAPVTVDLLPDAAFLPIPPRQCHTHKAAIVEAILAQDLPAVVAISAGPAAQAIIHELYPFIGDRSTLLSLGSLWGPFVGTLEHECYRHLSDEIMRRNRGDD